MYEVTLMPDIFISYSHKDQEFVRRLYGRLAEQKRDIWIDWEDIPPTSKWLAEIYRGIEGARAFIFVISPDSIASDTCRKELAHAIECGKRLVSIVRRDVPASELPGPVSHTQWLFFRESDDFENSFNALVKALDSEPEWVHQHTRFLTRAIQWDKNKRDDSLCLRGRELGEAEEWLAKAAINKEPKPTPLQLQYIVTSRRSATTRQHLVLGAVTVALTVALVLASVAWLQRNEAIYQGNVALAKQLAARAELIRNQSANEFPRGVLLAVESLKRFPSFEGDQAMRHSLALLPRLVTQKSNEPQRENVFEKSINTVAYSPDGKWLAAGTQDGSLFLYDRANWQEKWSVRFDGKGVIPAARQLAFSPDGQRLVSARDNGTQVWDVPTGRMISDLILGTQSIAAAFTTDGRYVVTGGDLIVHVFEPETGREMVKVEADAELIVPSPQGKIVALAGNSGTITLLDVTTGKKLIQKQQFTQNSTEMKAISAMAFSPDGRWIASGEGESWFGGTYPRVPVGGTVLIWDAQTGRDIIRLTHPDSVLSLDVSPDGEWLVTGCFDSRARVWNVTTGQLVAEFVHAGPVNTVRFTGDGERVISGSSDGTARIWEALTAKETSRMATESKAHIQTIALSPDGNQVAVGDDAGGLRVWEIAGEESAKLWHSESVSAVAFSPDGQRIATASWDRSARVWNATTGGELYTISYRDQAIIAMFSRDGRHMASGSLRGTVVVADTVSGKEILELPSLKSLGSIAFSPDSRWIAASQGSPPPDSWFILKRQPAAQPAQVLVYDIASGQPVAKLNHPGLVNSIAFSPDSKRMVTGSDDKIARVWDIATQTEVARIEHQERVNLVAWSPDGKWVASAEACFPVFAMNIPCKPIVQVWNPQNGQKLWQTTLDAPWIARLAFSPDSRLLAAGNSYIAGCPPVDKVCKDSARVWETTSGKEVSRINHEGLVIALTFSPDGKWIASGGGDKTLRIWDPWTSKEVTRFNTIEVWSVAFSPDNRWIAIGGYEEDYRSAVRIFPLRSDDLVSTACSRLGRNLMLSEWQQYIGNEPYRKTCPNLP